MTTPALPPPPASEPPIPVVTAVPGSRLEQLGAEYEIAYAANEAAKKRLDEIVYAIKVEATNAAPGQSKVDIRSATLSKALRLTGRPPSWRFNTDRFKADHPGLYVQYAKQGTKPVWELRRVAG